MGILQDPCRVWGVGFDGSYTNLKIGNLNAKSRADKSHWSLGQIVWSIFALFMNSAHLYEPCSQNASSTSLTVLVQHFVTLMTHVITLATAEALHNAHLCESPQAAARSLPNVDTGKH